jgi:hypothetical protein
MTPLILTMLLGAATSSGWWALSVLNMPTECFVPVFLLTLLGTLTCVGVLATQTLAVLEKKSK